jgi:hypothetical protein
MKLLNTRFANLTLIACALALCGCRGTRTLVETPPARPEGTACIIIEGRATGGYADIFDNGQVITVSGTKKPGVLFDSWAAKGFNRGEASEYIQAQNRMRPLYWIPAMSLADYYGELTKAIFVSPENAAHRGSWHHFENGRCRQGQAGDTSVQVSTSWEDPVPDPGSASGYAKAPAFLTGRGTVRQADGTSSLRLIRSALYSKYKPSDRTEFVDCLPQDELLGKPGYSDQEGELEYPIIIGSRWGKLFTSRALSEEEKRALIASYLENRAVEELTLIGRPGSQPLTWYRRPGKCRITMALSPKFSANWIDIARTYEFSAEAGKTYKFKWDAVHGHLELIPLA